MTDGFGDFGRTPLSPEDLAHLFDRLQWFGLHMHGIEVTQGIQYFGASQHLTDAADRGADNSVTLVAGKPAWVRVYVRAGMFGRADIAGVTGTLDVFHRRLGFLYANVATLAPQSPGTVTAQSHPTYAVERSSLNATLNFIVPANLMCGHLKLVATVRSPDGATATSEVFLDVTLRQTLRLRGVMVGYNGPASTAPNAANLTLNAPTVSDLQTTSSWALRAFPVESDATYSSAGAITLAVPLSDAPSCAGCCTPNWITLNSQVAAQVTADGNRTDVLYYGLIASGVPMGPIIGCESSGVSAGGVGNGVTLAHELGHHCGFPHAPCGGVGTPDPTYPAYEPYDPANTPTASIGEYGLDISNGNIMPPSMFKDMMSYCGPKWISLHNYGRLINHERLDPRRTCVDWPWWRDYVRYDPGLIPEKWLPDPPPDPIIRVADPVKLVSVIGVLHSEREFEVTSVMRVETQPLPVGGMRTDMSVVLLNADGTTVAEAPAFALTSRANCGGGCGGGGGCAGGCGGSDQYPMLVQALVPDAARGSELQLRRDGSVVWSRTRSEQRPKVAELAAQVAKGRLVLRMNVDAKDAECWVQWSAGRDGQWRALATGVRGERADFDLGLLPPGPCRLRLLVSDGFDTAVSKIVRITVPQRGPDIAILAPRDGETLVAGNPMRMWGAVSGADTGELKARWLLDGQAIGQGSDLFVTVPAAGKHTLEFEVGAGRSRSRTRVEFSSIDLEEELKRQHGLSAPGRG